MSQTPSGFDPYEYLPRSTTLDDPPRWITSLKHTVFADLDHDGQKESVVFYRYRYETGVPKGVGILVLEPAGHGFRVSASLEFHDSVAFLPPTGVLSSARLGFPQIVAYRAFGASCNGILEVYRYTGGGLESIPGPWTGGGACPSDLRLSDLDHDGTMEIIYEPYTHGSLPIVSRWTGASYVRASERFPELFETAAARYRAALEDPGPVPGSARLKWLHLAVTALLVAKKYNDAVTVAERGLLILANSAMSTPEEIAPRGRPQSRAQMEARRIRERYEKEELPRYKADIYRLLGDIYQTEGNRAAAGGYYKKASELLKDLQ